MTGKRPALRMALDSSVAIFEVLKPNRLCYEWERGAVIPLISDATAGELNRKLTELALKAGISDARRIALERRYLERCERVIIPVPPPAVPGETPPEDIPFVELAITASVDALVTRDEGLLRLNGQIIGNQGLAIAVVNVPDALRRIARVPQ